MLALSRIPATRIVAAAAALDAIEWPSGALAFRIAADEVLVTPPLSGIRLDDEHAIVVSEGGFAGAWLPADEALDLLARHCEWEIPRERPAFAQGAIAGLAAKVWLEKDRVLFIVPAPFVSDFEERMQ